MHLSLIVVLVGIWVGGFDLGKLFEMSFKNLSHLKPILIIQKVTKMKGNNLESIRIHIFISKQVV